MPKSTFFNLEPAKRNKIILAAKQEFTTNPLRNSRVSNIIKEAKIPRGSFYQYFDNLDDLYYYVLDDVFKNIYKAGTRFCDATDDIFEFSQMAFEFDYNGFINDMHHRFMLNVYKSISSNEDYIVNFMGILNKMDLTKIRFKEEEDLIKMYRMIQELKRSVIQRAVVENSSKEMASNEFSFFLDIIRNGLIKED